MPNKTVQAFKPILSIKPTAKGEQNVEFKPVQDFLMRFGYLAEGTFSDNELDNQTADALTKYQERNAIKTTGVFDEETRTQMTRHRCGLPDLDSGVAFSTRCAWQNPNLTYAFDDGTNDVTENGEFDAVRKAFDTWAAVTPLTFTEVEMNQNPDVVIDWRPANDPDLSMVGGVLAHADFPPGCGVVTDSLPKPVHFDDEEHEWVIGSEVDGFDVETVALHEIGHILGLQHSNVAGSVMFPTVSDNLTKRALTADDLSGIRELYAPNVVPRGVYTIRQESSGRFMDAHTSGNDFSVVTRTAQNNDTQRWVLNPVGAVYTIRQKGNGRFMDAHESGNDFSVVTRTAQNNDTQRWVLIPTDHDLCTYTAQQLSSRRFMDAHTSSNDFSVVTRTAQNNDTQRWGLSPEDNNIFTIQQKSNGRYVDAHTSGNDFSVVTRTAQNNDTQRWFFGLVGSVYTIQQKSSGRYVDAHTSGNDFSVVTRTAQNNDTQLWVLLPSDNGTFTLQQLSNARFMDAYESSTNDYSVVTRTDQNNSTQRWIIDPV